nr:hypothetical protein [Dechloromonas sp.]
MNTETSGLVIQYAIVNDCAVWGVGATLDDALADAAYWINGGEPGLKVADVERDLERPESNLSAIEKDALDFDERLQSHGSFVQRGGQWHCAD